MNPVREVVKEISVRNRTTLRVDRAQVVELLSSDAADVYALQAIAVSTLERPDLYAPLSESETRGMLNGAGRTLGVFVDNQLIAFRIVYFPDGQRDNLGLDVGIRGDELAQVGHLEASVVHPDFRGNGLQQSLTKQLIEILVAESILRHVMSTVSHLNHPSIRDKFGNGLQIVHMKEKYGGYLRYIFHRDVLAHPVTWMRTVNVRFDAVEEQGTLLSEGWRGYESTVCEGVNYVRYGLPDARLE